MFFKITPKRILNLRGCFLLGFFFTVFCFGFLKIYLNFDNIFCQGFYLLGFFYDYFLLKFFMLFFVEYFCNFI